MKKDHSHGKRRIPGIAAVLILLLLLPLSAAGCVRKLPDQPETPAGPTLGETICTAYRTVRGSQSEITEIRMIGSFLIAETDEYDEEGHELAWYAEEIVPDDPDALNAPASAAPDGGIPVTVRRYSSFSYAGEFWDEPDRYRMELTDEGLRFRAENGGENILRVPDPTLPEPGGIAGKIEELRQFSPAGTPDPSLVGGWSGGNGTEAVDMVFLGDGGFAAVSRDLSGEHPAEALIGAWSVSEEGDLLLHVRRIGYAGMPFDFAFETNRNEDGTLVMRLTDAPQEEALSFSPAEIPLRGRY